MGHHGKAAHAQRAGPSGTLTALAVGLVLVLRVGQGERRVGAAGQAGAAARLHPPGPESHGALRRHGPLPLGVRAGARGVAAVGQPHVHAEGGSPAGGWRLAEAQLSQAEVLPCKGGGDKGGGQRDRRRTWSPAPNHTEQRRSYPRWRPKSFNSCAPAWMSERAREGGREGWHRTSPQPKSDISAAQQPGCQSKQTPSSWSPSIHHIYSVIPITI